MIKQVKKALSYAVTIACILSMLTACGTASQQSAQPLASYKTEAHENEQGPQDPPAENPVNGFWHDETTPIIDDQSLPRFETQKPVDDVPANPPGEPDDGYWHEEPTQSGDTSSLPYDYIPYSIVVIYPDDEFDPEQAKEDMMRHVESLMQQLEDLVKSLGLWNYSAERFCGHQCMFEFPRSGTEFYADQIRIDSPKGRTAFRVQGEVFPEEHAYKCGYLTLTPQEMANELTFEYDSEGSLISSGYPAYWRVKVEGIEEIQNKLQTLKQ